MFNLFQKFKIILPTILVAFFLIGSFAFAQIDVQPELGATFGLGTQELYGTLINVVNIALGFLGVLAITFILYGGFVWMTSKGTPEKINQAKKILISALIGLAIVLLSFAIVQFIIITMAGPSGPAPGISCDCVTELGICDPGGSCVRCQATATPGACAWQTDNSCPGCGGLPVVFEVVSIVPGHDPCPLNGTNPRNSVIRIYFNKNVDPATVNSGTIVIRGTGSSSQCAGGVLGIIAGDFTVNGNKVEFRPSIGTCPANPCGADRCFDDDSTIDIDVLLGAGGVLSTTGDTLTDNLSVEENPQFFTSDAIDCQDPTVALSFGNQICLDTPNSLGSISSDDSGISDVEFSDNNFNLAFPGAIPTIVPCPPGPGPCGKLPANWIIAPGSAVWTPVAPAYTAGDLYTITATASDLDDNVAQDSQTFTMRAAHCCNGVQDVDEEGIDCGGADCALCDGAACGIDQSTDCSTDNCSDNNNLCASNLCSCTAIAGDCLAAGYDAGVDPCCLCKGAPIIDCITPNDTDSCDPHGIPLGTNGNLISIWGRDFGVYDPAISRVNFINFLNPFDIITADLAETVNGLCINSWTDTQIIAVVPNIPITWTSGAVIEIIDAGLMSDTTNDTRGNLIPEFTDDGIVRPSLCLVENIEFGSGCFGSNCGFFEELVLGHGINILAGSIVEFGNVGIGVPGLSPNPIPDLQIESRVSNIESGKVGYSVLSSVGERSNYLNFTVTSSVAGPHIDYLDPDFGPERQYVTIYGSGFGSTQAGSSVTFNGVAGDFSFPAECANSYWNENYIIVKVPAGATDGDVVVTVGGIPSNGESFDVCSGVGCPLLSGMCKIDPVKGPFNTPIDIYGNNFGTLTGDVEFYDGTPAFPNVSAFGISLWGDSFIQDAIVPGGAESGPVYTEDAGNNYSSNSIPFEIGECANDSECPAGSVCCDSVCNVGVSCPSPNFSTYTWSFTTGNYFIKEECGPGAPVPSPTPWSGRSGGTEVCINAAIGASFTENIIQTSVDNTTVLVQECIDPGSNPCNTLSASINGIVVTAPYVVVPAEINAFRFEPTGLLNQDAWYRVTLRGGVGNITAVTGNTPLIDDYVWQFKTRASDEQCEFDSVKVTPNPAKLVDINATQTFIAEPINKNDPCIILNGSLYNWSWMSTDTNIADVLGSTIDTETATPVGNGSTKIRATLLPDNITGEAILAVDFLGLSIINHKYECDEVCINALLELRFDKQVEPSTLAGSTGNIGVYECLDGLPCHDYPSFLAISDPETSYIWDNTTGDSFTTFASSTANFLPNQYHRVVVDTSDAGIKSILGNPVINPNSDLAYGEECDDSADPLCDNITCLWTGSVCGTTNQECFAGFPGCDVNCLHTGSMGVVCGNGIVDTTRGENCDDGGNCNDGTNCTVGGPPCGDGSICFPVSGDGCSVNCLFEEPIGTAICGNGIIEPGEACDDNNQTNNDGCNSSCLREGKLAEANPAYTFICGDNNIETDAITGAGEDCDDGNLVNNDGCSANCLSDGAVESVCGDGQIGIGEDCDGEPGCGATCLWVGSSGIATCGNNVVEKNELDYYSWVFKTRDISDPCLTNSVDVIPLSTTVPMGEILDYIAIPRASGDSCDPNGQTLDPSVYDWTWSSDDNLIATVTNNDIDGDLLVDSKQEVSAIAAGVTNINAEAIVSVIGSGTIEVVEPVPPGTPCIISGSSCCNEGVSSCAEGYECLTDNSNCDADLTAGSPLNTTNNCRCCCNPSLDTCPDPLECLANISPCSGGSRGMCCGCQSDAECGVSGYCGNDTCCYPAPQVVPPETPDDGSSEICLNALISASFDQEMDIKTFRNNIEVVGDYTAEGVCPDNTTTPIFYTSVGTWCAIEGSVGSAIDVNGNSIIEFMPDEMLESNRAYTVIIHGTIAANATCGDNKIDPGEDCDDGNSVNNDGCSSTCLNEGTTDKCGNYKIDWGEECDDGGECGDGTQCVIGGTPCGFGNCVPQSGDGCDDTCLRDGSGYSCPDSNIERDSITGAGEDCDGGAGCDAFNCINLGTVQTGVKSAKDINMLNDHSWNFTTGENICEIGYIRLNVKVGDNPYPPIVYQDVQSDLFICAGRDDCKRDALRDSSVPDPAGNQHVFRIYPIDSVTGSVLNPNDFTWSWNESDPYDVFELLESEAPDPEIDTRSEITSNVQNGKGFIDIEAVGINSLLGQAQKRARVEVFLCDNPWPSIDTWPWEDNIVDNADAICDDVGVCNNTFFELYYCRDAGDPGIADDLPQIAANPLTFAESGEILKEFFFIEDESGSGGPIIFNTLVTPCSGGMGTTFNISAQIVDLDGVDTTINPPIAYIKTSLFEDITDPAFPVNRIITLTDPNGDNIYTGSWTDTICPDECMRFVDIVATDTLGNESTAENSQCK